MLALLPLATLTIADVYLQRLWQDSAMAASQAGYHQDGVDARLDDLSPETRARRRQFLHDFQNARSQNVDELADQQLVENAIALELLDIEEAHDYERRADQPLDALGDTFFQMTVRDYAPLDRRRADVIARLQAVRRYLAQAQANLKTYVDVFAEAAKDDGEGLISYFDHEVIEKFAVGKEADQVKMAVGSAKVAVKKYLEFVERELPKKSRGSFRYRQDWYEKRFRPYLQTDNSPAQVLALAQKRMAEIHAEMKLLAKQVSPSAEVRQALGQVAEETIRPDRFLDEVRRELGEARRFIEQKKLLPLGTHDNLQVIETPPFLRSLLGVAAFDGAPPLEPALGAYYYVTPFPSDWPKAKLESKLREYNRFALTLITIHEAMPGHYVQFEHANRVEPESRRVLRWVLGANSFIEGWAVYTQDLLTDAGFLGGDARLKLAARKLELRAVANAILDIRLHTEALSDDMALKFLTEEAFQERTEAEQKLRRAKLSVTQLCSYFVGGESWKALRHDAEKRAGKNFDLAAFHQQALSHGSVPLTVLRKFIE